MGEGLEVFFYFGKTDVGGTGLEVVWNVNRGIGIVIGGFFSNEGGGSTCWSGSVD
jgi:hypothetical protein